MSVQFTEMPATGEWVWDTPTKSWVPRISPAKVPEINGWSWDEATHEWKKEGVSTPFAVIGFPRSGNTFLLHAISLLYSPEKETPPANHSANALKTAGNILVPFRSPLDSIVSQRAVSHPTYPPQVSYQRLIVKYLDFSTSVLENLDRVLLMEFSQFTNDLTYIADRIHSRFGVSPTSSSSVEDVKEIMRSSSLTINLPRPNLTPVLEALREELLNIPEFSECQALYEQLTLAHG